MIILNLFKNSFDNLSIKQKLLILAFLVCIPSLLISMSIIGFFGFEHARKELHKELQTITDITGSHLSGALAFEDKKRAYEILGSLKFHKAMLAACLYDNTEHLFAAYGPPGAHDCNRDHSKPISAAKNELVLSTVIQRRELRAGSLEIHASLLPLNHYIDNQVFLMVACFGGVIIFISLPIAYFYQRNISGPVYKLLETSREISHFSPASIENYKSADEIGLSIQMLEGVKALAKTYFESRRDAESILANKSIFLAVMDDKIKTHERLYSTLKTIIQEESAENKTETERYALELYPGLNKEIERLLYFFKGLHNSEASILRNDVRVIFSHKELMAVLQEASTHLNASNVEVVVKDPKSPWFARAYFEAIQCSLFGLFEMLNAFCLENEDYQITTEFENANNPEIHTTLTCMSIEGVPQRNRFNFDSQAFETAFLKLKHYGNINAPNEDSVRVFENPKAIKIIIRAA